VDKQAALRDVDKQAALRDVDKQAALCDVDKCLFSYAILPFFWRTIQRE
jgi:hypothetical protein